MAVRINNCLPAVKGDRIPGGQPSIRKGQRITRPCSTCGARPYEKCRIEVSGRTRQNPDGVPYYRTLAKLHTRRGRDADVPV